MKRHKQPHRVRQLILPALLLILFVVGFFLVPKLPFDRESRAHRQINAGVQAFAEGDYAAAFEHARAARHIAPGLMRARLLEARAALRLEDPRALELWKPLLHDSEVVAEDIAGLAAFVASGGQPEEANRLLPLLLSKDPRSPQARELQLRALENDLRFASIENLARKWIEQGADDWFVHEAYVGALLRMPSEEKRQRAMEHLQRLAERRSDLGVRALRMLINLSQAPDQIQQLVARLESHPRAEASDQFTIVSWRYSSEGSISFNVANEQVRELLPLNTAQGRRQYLLWLVRMNRYDRFLSEITAEEGLADAEMARRYLLALVEDGQAEAVLDLTSDFKREQLPLPEAEADLFRARAHASRGQIEARDEALGWAATLADGASASRVEEELSRLRQWETLEYFHRRLLAQAETATLGAQRLLRTTYSRGDEVNLMRALDEVRFDHFREAPEAALLLAYLNLLYKPDRVLRSIEVLEDLVVAYPNIFEFRIVLALAYRLRGHDEVIARFEPALPLSPPQGRDPHLQVAHYIALAGPDGPYADPAGPRAYLDLNRLLPRERAVVEALR
ncbi:MAG: hypothetical protein ACLFR7_09090 [Opitutales bacterium]